MIKNIKHDKIFVGAGIIHLIEAMYQKKLGKKVLVLEKKDKLGGAWQPIDIFGFKNVENAIHYFLPDKKAPEFMKKKLNWPIIESEKKFRCIKLPILGYCYIKYDSFFSHLISELDFNKKNISFLINIIQVLLCLVIKINKSKSYYISGGAPFIYKYIKKMIKYNNINIIYNTDIDGIYFDKKNNVVRISSGSNFFVSKQIVVSHGSRLKNINTAGGAFDIIEKIYPRPALHILIKDSTPSKIKECILYKNSIVKYVHDVTDMISDLEKIDEKKIFIFGMQSNIANNKESIDYAFNLLKNIKLISKNAIMIDFLWSDTILPTLHDEDLEKLKNKFGNLVDYLKTEDFAKGVGYYCEKWSKEDIFI